MSLMDYKELFEPYTGDGHTLEAAIKFWAKVAAKNNIKTDTMELAINEVFTEMSNGRKFDLAKCHCGCGIDKAATDLIHTVLERMQSIDREKTAAVNFLMQKRMDLVINEHMKRISKTNKEYIKMNRPPLSERSPILRGLKRVFRV